MRRKGVEIVAVKRKRMTQKEKRERAQVKKMLQEKGVIPPDKPKLNRKKFIEEAKKEWDNKPGFYIWDFYLIKAVSYILTKTEGRNSAVSKEAVGAAKILKLALRLQKFHEKLKKEGKTEYKLLEEYDYIKDILDA